MPYMPYYLMKYEALEFTDRGMKIVKKEVFIQANNLGKADKTAREFFKKSQQKAHIVKVSEIESRVWRVEELSVTSDEYFWYKATVKADKENVSMYLPANDPIQAVRLIEGMKNDINAQMSIFEADELVIQSISRTKIEPEILREEGMETEVDDEA